MGQIDFAYNIIDVSLYLPEHNGKLIQIWRHPSKIRIFWNALVVSKWNLTSGKFVTWEYYIFYDDPVCVRGELSWLSHIILLTCTRNRDKSIKLAKEIDDYIFVEVTIHYHLSIKRKTRKPVKNEHTIDCLILLLQKWKSSKSLLYRIFIFFHRYKYTWI